MDKCCWDLKRHRPPPDLLNEQSRFKHEHQCKCQPLYLLINVPHLVEGYGTTHDLESVMPPSSSNIAID